MASPLTPAPLPFLPALPPSQFGGDSYGVSNELWSLRGVVDGDGEAQPQWTQLTLEGPAPAPRCVRPWREWAGHAMPLPLYTSFALLLCWQKCGGLGQPEYSLQGSSAFKLGSAGGWHLGLAAVC